MPQQDLVWKSAVELAGLIRRREVSCTEVVSAHLAQLDFCNERLNAVVTRTDAQALETAQSLDDRLARGEVLGPLAGLPVAHKDLALTKGVRTTFGSKTKADFVPEENSLPVQRMHEAGAIMLGKTNTPEFGAGSQTFNEVFGVTRNPYNPELTCGGSSGGAAVALAAGMVSLADGSDMGGSLRNPAAWCNVVGLRPTPGRVPSWPTQYPLATLPVEGPMARTVEDVALFMSAIAGPDSRCPLSRRLSEQDFTKALTRSFSGCAVAVASDYAGQLPLVEGMAAYVERGAQVLADAGAVLSEELPDLANIDEVFKTLRASLYAGMLGPALDQHRADFKQTLIWNIEQGLKLSPKKVEDAQLELERIRQRFDRFFERFEYLLLPVTQLHPFPVDLPYPESVAGEPMHSYLDWMRSCYFITVPGHPAVSVPVGFTDEGLPVGLQIVGRYGDDFGVLQAAWAVQQATGCGRQRPPACVQ
ncbi:MAG: amidase [Pseudomonadota bacterium]